MLRTIAAKGDLIKGTIRKVAVRNITRTLSVECAKRIPYNRKQIENRQQTLTPCNFQIVRYYSSDLPPHTKVTLPALSPTMEEGTIISWAKKEGDKLNEGDLLAEIETDKATMGFETPEEGYLAKILIPAGTKGIKVGKLVCIIVENQADVAKFKDFKDDGAAASAPSAPAATAPPPAAAAPPPVAAPSAPHSRVTLPALSPTMEMGNIIAWSKKVGDKLNEGDMLAEIETDKATMAFETPEEGYLAKIMIPAGTKGIPIGKLVCIIVENESDVAAFKDFTDDGAAAAPAPKSAAAPSAGAPAPSAPAAAAPPPPPAAAAGDRVYASPMAKRLAEQRKIRLQGKGTGMFGSITSKDLDHLKAAPAPTVGAAAPPPPPGQPTPAPGAKGPAPSSPFTDVPVSSIRGVIAKRLSLSKQTIPHYYLTVEINVDKLMEVREKFNKALEKQKIKLSLNDFIIKATAMASKKVPEANSVWMDTIIRMYKNVDVSVAVSTPTGLITPIIFEANNKGVVDISKEVKTLAAKARENKLLPHEFQGGTISVSNLGMFGVTFFEAIINPGQSCILAVGTTVKRLVVDPKAEKGFSEANFLTVSLSCDHRIVDGAVGAQWLDAFRSYLEDPVNMIM